MQDTWWGKVIDFFSGELLVNNSWSGSRVTRLPNNDSLFPSGCSDVRTGGLHINSVKPDVIIVYLGTNDWAFGARRNDETRVLDFDEMEYFESAYDGMLRKLKSNYPKAEIWCCTLCSTKISTNPSFTFPDNYHGNDVNYYNHAIRDIVLKNNCKLIDLYSYYLPYDSIDGTHPNADGMNTLATLIIRSTGGKQIEQFMDCENDQHEYFVAEQYSEATKYICKKCCKIYFLSDHYDEFYDIEPPSKCPKCQGKFKMTDQTGDYDYYTCEDCGNNICVSPFSILNESDKENTAMNEKTYSSDAEYVCLPSDITRVLFDNILKLYDVNANQNIEIQNEKIDVGRSPDCELYIDDNYISQKHASFYHEDSCWFIMDKGSRNGTWLNNNKLAQNTKYELCFGDVISFAKIKSYVFYNPIENNPHKYSENEITNDNSADIRVGSVLDNRYELLREVGRGGISTVYLARDTRINKMWAIKIAKTEINNKADSIRESIIQEAEMIKSLDHISLPKVVDIISCTNFVAIVMDYVEGETLETIVMEFGAQSVDSVIDWAKQICNVLGYLHSQNPPHIYRDMKPSNIILRPDGSIKIVDFGLMRTYNQNQSKDTCYLGTRGYAAPEQYGGRGQCDARTDIYGLGMTVYHLLTGLDPKEIGFSLKPICQVNPSLPKGLEYIVEKCTQNDPANRYQSCTDLLNDLNRYQQLPPKKSLLDKIFKH